MKALLCETAHAFVQRETGAIAGIERAIQAATAPTLGQQMLQRGSRDAIANGTSHEQSSISVNAEGKQVAERKVQRSVVMPNGQAVQIQQVVQQVVLPESELGKRKVQDDLELVELRLRSLKCDQMELELQQMKTQFSMDNSQLMIKNQIDNEQKIKENELKIKEKKMSIVSTFANTMDLLNEEWRVDKRLVVQVEDYMRNGIFNGSSNQPVEDAVSQTDSISISQVAFEIGIRITSSQCISVGAKVAKAYKDKYGEKPSKHNQTVHGQVTLPNR